MNVTESKAESFDDTCPMNEKFWTQEHQVEKVAFAMTTIFLNILTSPVTIVMNVLVIMAVKTRPRLRSKYNILLACLAGTDLLIGVASQPSYIVGQIYVMKGISASEYCEYHKLTNLLVLSPIFASVLHLALISIERFVAMKYTFRYLTFFTGLRLKIAVVSTWVFAFFPAILGSLSKTLGFISNVVSMIVLFVNIFLILFCHLSVYFVTRRHEKQIKCEQVSPEAAAEFAKEKKALKTTRIIIMALLACLFPLSMYVFFWLLFSKRDCFLGSVILLSHPVFVWLSSLNSLCNPFIYCYRNKMFRKACNELVRMKCTDFNEVEELIKMSITGVWNG